MKKKTFVIGASLNPVRYSNIAIHRLVNHQHKVVAFGLRKGTISGVEIDTDLRQYNNVHTVTLYLNPERQKTYYDYIISLEPERVIFNPGTENPEFQKLLISKGIFFEEACTLVLLGTNQY